MLWTPDRRHRASATAAPGRVPSAPTALGRIATVARVRRSASADHWGWRSAVARGAVCQRTARNVLAWGGKETSAEGGGAISNHRARGFAHHEHAQKQVLPYCACQVSLSQRSTTNTANASSAAPTADKCVCTKRAPSGAAKNTVPASVASPTALRVRGQNVTSTKTAKATSMKSIMFAVYKQEACHGK